ncbi:MAG: hypothetical protein U5Q44_09420 [Dehalococcoidia bacterium]|nr:hypothetical protein [Dehalococcoidia bacterium]
MEISTLHEEERPIGLVFQSTVVAEYQHRHVGLLDMPAQLNPAFPILRMCSYCKRVEHPAGSGEWLAPISYEDAGGTTDVRISHGICPACERDIVEPLLALQS